MGEQVDPTAFDVLGYSVINSSTLGDALDRAMRYNSIWTNGSCFAIHKGTSKTAIVYSYLDKAIGEHRHDAEMTFAALAVLGRRVTNVDWWADEVKFQHARPSSTREHERIFGCRVSVSCTENELVSIRVSGYSASQADPSCVRADRHAKSCCKSIP